MGSIKMHHLTKVVAVLSFLTVPAMAASTLSNDLVSGLEPSAEIVGGFTDEFLRNSQVSEDERRCLSKSSSSLASSLANACERALEIYKQFTEPVMPQGMPAVRSMATANQVAPDAPASNYAVPPVGLPVGVSAAAPIATVSDGEEAVVAMELAASLSHVYKMQAKVAKACLKGDVLDEFEQAEKHLSNMTFVSGRLLTEGVDVMDELSDAFNSFEHHSYRAFGKDLGVAGRKVLLAKRSGLADFTEPSPEAIEQVTEGLFASFFGKGYDLQLVADDVPSNVPMTAPQIQKAMPEVGMPPSTWHWGSLEVHNEVIPTGTQPSMAPLAAVTPVPATLNLDLHKCISGNMPLWKSAWAPVWELASAASESESEVPEINDMMVSLMDVQMAIMRCKITPEMEAVLIDSMEKGKLHANLKTPEGNIQTGNVPSLLASALEDFRDEHWYEFGKQLGAAIQDLGFVTFDQKYEVGTAGSSPYTSRQSLGVVVVGAVSVGFLAMFSMMRGRRAVGAALGSGSSRPEFDRLRMMNSDDLEAFVE